MSTWSTTPNPPSNPPVRRRRFGLGALFVTVVGVTGVTMVALLIAAVSLNPFASKTTEAKDSVVLAKMQDLARFDAATGRFTTVVDEQSSTKMLPTWASGERVVLEAEGDVAASVDFSKLGTDAIKLSDGGKTAVVHLPDPVLDPPRLDPDTTRVITRDRGVLDRLGDAVSGADPSNDQHLYQRATEKLADAAAQSDLTARARANTEKFVRDTLRASGVQNVTVVFDAAPAGQAA